MIDDGFDLILKWIFGEIFFLIEIGKPSEYILHILMILISFNSEGYFGLIV